MIGFQSISNIEDFDYFNISCDFDTKENFSSTMDTFLDCVDLTGDISGHASFPNGTGSDDCFMDTNIVMNMNRSGTFASGNRTTNGNDIRDGIDDIDGDLITSIPNIDLIYARERPTFGSGSNIDLISARERPPAVAPAHGENGDLAVRPTYTHSLQPDLIFRQDEDGDTVLHTAIIMLNSQIAIRCIESATSSDMLSIKNKLLQSPLHLAVLTNQEIVVRKLLLCGADIKSRDMKGNTPLLLACKHNYVDIVNTILQPMHGYEGLNTPPFRRIQEHCLEVKNYDGLTALHLAASNGTSAGPIVELLIRKGADVNAIDGKTGRTVLHNACISGDVALVRALLKVDACDVNARTFDDYTPFDLARVKRHDEIQILLAKFGAGSESLDE